MRNVLQMGNRLHHGFDHANIRLIWVIWAVDSTMAFYQKTENASRKSPEKSGLFGIFVVLSPNTPQNITMSNDALIEKIKKALLVLQISNFTAGLAFFSGYFLQGDMLFIIAGACMMIAVIGLQALRKRIFAKLEQ